MADTNTKNNLMVILNKIGKKVSLKKYKKFLLKNRNLRNNRQFSKLLFDLCEDCNKMPSLPQGAFAARKLREYSKKDMIVARIQNGDKNSKSYCDSKELMEYTPVKYNSKLMNSIWGLYNRYSPHNIKSNENVLSISQQHLQQPLTVASYAIVENITLATESGIYWNFPQ